MILHRKDVTPFVVPDGQVTLIKSQARVGATPQTPTEETWVISAWALVEQWTERLWLRGSQDYREGTYEVELTSSDRNRDLPMMLSAVNTPDVTVQSFERWDHQTDDYVAFTDWKKRPGSRWYVSSYFTPIDYSNRLYLDSAPNDVYKLVSRATPDEDIPGDVIQAVARAAAWLRSYSPSDVRSDGIGGTAIPVSVAGAIMRSGAAELLFPYRGIRR